MANLEVRLPKLAMSIVEAVIIEWLVAVGDDVVPGQPLVLLGLDKAETELPSPAAGRVALICAAVDETVEVGRVLLSIDT